MNGGLTSSPPASWLICDPMSQVLRDGLVVASYLAHQCMPSITLNSSRSQIPELPAAGKYFKHITTQLPRLSQCVWILEVGSSSRQLSHPITQCSNI